ncbi:MAG: DNA-directed RNA polymerase subunit K/omega [Saprospiraceae bacterium]|jgi:DNA-directed RNA polymerase subunit K/omega|tara:strand:+ start:480 stop:809 length:330 start_codon:yes stop_codon:yes gene_type:complete
MADIKQKAQGMYSSAQPRNISELIKDTHNIYESLCIISKRATQIAVQMKRELHAKLEEFASTTENLEEIHENKEQIEISKFYERLPNPAIIATNEFLEGTLYHRYRDTK